jgi:hypothetical protein
MSKINPPYWLTAIPHARVWFWHAACDFHTHSCDFHNRAYGSHTLRVEQLYCNININLSCWHLAAAIKKNYHTYVCRTLRSIVTVPLCRLNTHACSKSIVLIWLIFFLHYTVACIIRRRRTTAHKSYRAACRIETQILTVWISSK